jgi:hypothetical protein
LLDLPHVQTSGEQDTFWRRFTEVADRKFGGITVRDPFAS